MSPDQATERRILLAPAVVARAAARVAPDAEGRWMLRQPLAVRRSFVEEVHGRPDEERLREIWMLRQQAPVRESFVVEVLLRQAPPPRQEIWMLLQADEVRESYVRDVLLADG